MSDLPLRHCIFGKYSEYYSSNNAIPDYELLACWPAAAKDEFQSACDKTLTSFARALARGRTNAHVHAYLPNSAAGGGIYLRLLPATQKDKAGRAIDACFHAVFLDAPALQQLGFDPRRLNAFLADRIEASSVAGPDEMSQSVVQASAPREQPVELPIHVDLIAAEGSGSVRAARSGQLARGWLEKGWNILIDSADTSAAGDVAQALLLYCQEQRILPVICWDVPKLAENEQWNPSDALPDRRMPMIVVLEGSGSIKLAGQNWANWSFIKDGMQVSPAPGFDEGWSGMHDRRSTPDKPAQEFDPARLPENRAPLNWARRKEPELTGGATLHGGASASAEIQSKERGTDAARGAVPNPVPPKDPAPRGGTPVPASLPRSSNFSLLLLPLIVVFTAAFFGAMGWYLGGRGTDSKIADKNAVIKDLNEQLRKEHEINSLSGDEKSTQIKTLQKTLEAVRADLTVQKAEVEKLNAQRAKMNSDMENLTATMEQKRLLEEKKGKDALSQKNAEHQREITNLNMQIAEAQNANLQLKNEKNAAETVVAQLKKQLSEAQQQYAELNDKYAKLGKENTNQDYDLNYLKTKINDLTSKLKTSDERSNKSTSLNAEVLNELRKVRDNLAAQQVSDKKVAALRDTVQYDIDNLLNKFQAKLKSGDAIDEREKELRAIQNGIANAVKKLQGGFDPVNTANSRLDEELEKLRSRFDQQIEKVGELRQSPSNDVVKREAIFSKWTNDAGTEKAQLARILDSIAKSLANPASPELIKGVTDLSDWNDRFEKLIVRLNEIRQAP